MEASIPATNNLRTMPESFRHKLDVYYVATIAYVLTLIAYVAVRGTVEGGKFEVVLRDPIVYLLAVCTAASLVGLGISALLGRRVIIRDNRLVFITRFKERVIQPEDIEWIGFRREEAKVRGGRAYPTARFKLRNRRRLLRLRVANFERKSELARALKEWTTNNNVTLLRGKKKRGGSSQ